MKQYLTDLNIGYVPEKDKKYNWFQNGKKFNEDVKKCWLACKLNNNLGDISRVEKLPEADLWTMSFPCTDISVAGKMKGLNPDDNTRSSLIWQTIRLLKKAQETNTLPKYILLENVKNLIGKRFIHDFETFNELIESFGYHTYYKVLNACECGVPQNRERVFAIYIRTDIDSGKFTFPIPFDNGLRLKDVLEDEVDEKYYINTQKAKDLIQKLIDEGTLEDPNVDIIYLDYDITKKDNFVEQNRTKQLTTRFSDISSTLRATTYKQGERNILENIKNGNGNGNEGIIEFKH